MAQAIFVFVSLALLVGFFLLVSYENKRGVRWYAERRARLDAEVTRVEFIMTHVDLAAFAFDEARGLAHRVGHDAVHFTLRAVRAVERLLTRLVRRLRSTAVENEAPRETTREFVRTLSDFKDTLEATHPEIQDVDEVK